MSLNERRSIFVYEAARLAAIAADAPIIPVLFADRESDFQDEFFAAIEVQCGTFRILKSSEVIHDIWVRTYRSMGWIYGESYDLENRIHPDLVPFSELGQLEQDKDSVFLALCEIARCWIRE